MGGRKGRGGEDVNSKIFISFEWLEKFQWDFQERCGLWLPKLFRVKKQVIHDLKNVENWLEANKIFLNADKFELVPFTSPKKQLDIEAVTGKCSVKKVLLEISKNSQENTCARVSTGQTATLLKKRLSRRCFPVNIVKFLRTSFLTEHLRWLLLLTVIWKSN